jgi:RNA-directed DNA polymerase
MSEQQKLTRQEIYDRIRESSKDEFILSEMVRLGFWQQNKDKPALTEQFLNRRLELQKKLRELGQSYRLYQDPEKALKELHKERKKRALERREQTRQAENQRRHERALAWHHKQQTAIHYVGDDYSYGLSGAQSDQQRLAAHGLADYADGKAMAEAMGISLNELRFLCFQKEVSQVNHYQRFDIAKKTGGVRTISAPMPRLKRAQYWLLDNLLNKVALHDAAHGFVKDRSILTNALPHVKKAVVINLDLENFFPTINYPRVKGMYRQLGYSESIATLLALLSTEPETDAVDMDNQTWYVQQGERFLPQGAPTSPAITNIICRRLDSRLAAMATKLGFSYSRYADDMTFSGDNPQAVQQLLWRCKQIIKDEGFIVHPKKTRIMRRHQKQEVTGVVVNEKPSIDRETLKRFRALLFQIDKDGPDGKRWGCGELMACIDGYANFVAMIAADKGIPLQKQVAALKQKYGYQVKSGRLSALNKKLFRLKSAKGEAPRSEWWQAQAANAPEMEKTAQQRTEEKKIMRQTANTVQRPSDDAGVASSPTSSHPLPPKTRYRIMIAVAVVIVLALVSCGTFAIAWLIGR